MRIDPATNVNVQWVAERLRARDRAELTAVTYLSDSSELSGILARRYGYRRDALCASTDDGEPVAIGCAAQLRPNVLTLAFFATERFSEIAKPLTRFMKQKYFPPLVAAGVHRIECVSVEGYKLSHRWLKTLGLSQETEPLKGYGKAGEGFVSFSWVGDVRTPSA